MIIVCEVLVYLAIVFHYLMVLAEIEFCLMFFQGASYSCQIAKVYKFKEKELQ